MPKISLGPLDLNVDAEPTSGIAKYFRGLVSLVGSQGAANALRSIRDTPLKDVPAESIALGLSIERDIDVGNAGTEWTVEAGTGARLLFFKPGDAVLTDEMFGSEVALSAPGGAAYVGLELQARIQSGITAGMGDLAFGFFGGTTFTAATYHAFDAETTVLAGTTQTLIAFHVPGDWEDLLALPDKSAMAAAGSGRLAFSVTGEFASSVNPLATTIPFADVDVTATAGGSVSVAVDVEVSTEYEIRVIRHDRNVLFIGYYRKGTGELDIEVTAKAGASVTVGGTDLLPRLIGALDRSAETDNEFLWRAGLSDTQIARIETTVKDAVNRKLEASLGGAFRRLRSAEAAFLFRVDIAATDEAARSAVRRALDGDIRGLTAGNLPVGITAVRTILTDTWKRSLTLRINVLGIFNYASISDLLKEDRVLLDPATGDVIITDKAVATRIRASMLHMEADPQKLRRVMYESFLATATYCGSQLLRSPGAISACHTYFELHGKTNHQILKDYLDVLSALDLSVGDSDGKAILQSAAARGRSALYVETRYVPTAMRGLFFDSTGALRRYEAYTQAGRTALDLLVRAGDENNYRRVLVDQPVWDALERAGSGSNAHRSLRASHPTLTEVARETIYSDYRLIVFWADSMVSLGNEIAKIDSFFNANPAGVARDKRLKKLRDRLRDRLADVTKKTKEQFGDPWGLVAADLASDRQSTASARITTDSAEVAVDRTVVSAATGR